MSDVVGASVERAAQMFKSFDGSALGVAGWDGMSRVQAACCSTTECLDPPHGLREFRSITIEHSAENGSFLRVTTGGRPDQDLLGLLVLEGERRPFPHDDPFMTKERATATRLTVTVPVRDVPVDFTGFGRGGAFALKTLDHDPLITLVGSRVDLGPVGLEPLTDLDSLIAGYRAEVLPLG